MTLKQKFTSFTRQVLTLLKQGVSVSKIAWAISLGLLFCVFPIVGLPTLFCFLAAIVWGLNMPLIQAVNYLAAPLQWILMIPFIQLGAMLLKTEQTTLTLADLKESFSSGTGGFFSTFLDIALQAMLGWVVLAVPLLPILYFTLSLILKKSFPKLER